MALPMENRLTRALIKINVRTGLELGGVLKRGICSTSCYDDTKSRAGSFPFLPGNWPNKAVPAATYLALVFLACGFSFGLQAIFLGN